MERTRAYQIAQVIEKFGGFAGAPVTEGKQPWIPLYKRGCCLSTQKFRVLQYIVQEVDVCLDASDVKLEKRPLHLLYC